MEIASIINEYYDAFSSWCGDAAKSNESIGKQEVRLTYKTRIELKAPLSELQFLKWRQQSKKTSAYYI